jgi:hypothetical protein
VRVDQSEPVNTQDISEIIEITKLSATSNPDHAALPPQLKTQCKEKMREEKEEEIQREQWTRLCGVDYTCS